MAELKNCPKCDTAISKNTHALHKKARYGAMLCPNCGQSIPRGERTVITTMFIFGILVLVFALVGWASIGWAGL
jgi:transcription elongation factor Elf1